MKSRMVSLNVAGKRLGQTPQSVLTLALREGMDITPVGQTFGIAESDVDRLGAVFEQLAERRKTLGLLKSASA